MAYRLKDKTSGKTLKTWQELPTFIEVPGGQAHALDKGWSDETLVFEEYVSSEDVNNERERRVFAGFDFAGHTYQSDPESRAALADKAVAAVQAQAMNAEVGDVMWDGTGRPFAWRDVDNADVPMDAQELLDLHKAAVAHRETLRLKASALKAQHPIPNDYKADSYWS